MPRGGVSRPAFHVDDPVAVGRRIRDLRQQLGLSLRQVAGPGARRIPVAGGARPARAVRSASAVWRQLGTTLEDLGGRDIRRESRRRLLDLELAAGWVTRPRRTRAPSARGCGPDRRPARAQAAARCSPSCRAPRRRGGAAVRGGDRGGRFGHQPSPARLHEALGAYAGLGQTTARSTSCARRSRTPSPPTVPRSAVRVLLASAHRCRPVHEAASDARCDQGRTRCPERPCDTCPARVGDLTGVRRARPGRSRRALCTACRLGAGARRASAPARPVAHAPRQHPSRSQPPRRGRCRARPCGRRARAWRRREARARPPRLRARPGGAPRRPARRRRDAGPRRPRSHGGDRARNGRDALHAARQIALARGDLDEAAAVQRGGQGPSRERSRCTTSTTSGRRSPTSRRAGDLPAALAALRRVTGGRPPVPKT